MITKNLAAVINDGITVLFWNGVKLGHVYPDGDEWIAFDGKQSYRFPYPATAERFLIRQAK